MAHGCHSDNDVGGWIIHVVANPELIQRFVTNVSNGRYERSSFLERNL